MTENNIWTHYNPVNITFGPGAIKHLQELVPSQGNLLLITTPGFTRRGVTKQVLDQIGQDRIVTYDETTPNPDLDDLDLVYHRFKNHDFVGVIGLGGGSIIDAAKMLGVSLASSYDKPLDRALRQGEPENSQKKLFVTAIPTTSGTGAEVTPFATVWDNVNKRKYSLAGHHIYPCNTILDTELTITLPRKETLYTGLDAISHSLESLWNKNRTPVSEIFALRALRLANQALPLVIEQPSNLDARTKMQEASLLAGMAISQTRTAIAHSISYPVTIHYGVPHGLACSFTLPGLIHWYLPTLDNSEEKQVLSDIQKTLSRLNLKNEIQNYNIDPQIHLDEMFHPERADNFSLKIKTKDVYDLLLQSL